jgi:hypothetical protein
MQQTQKRCLKSQLPIELEETMPADSSTAGMTHILLYLATSHWAFLVFSDRGS